MSLTLPRAAPAVIAAFALGSFAAAPAPASPAPSATFTVKTDVACTAAATAGPVKVASDPEEGGQIVARTAKPAPKPKPQISDINVMKTSDKASPSMAATAPAAPACQH